MKHPSPLSLCLPDSSRWNFGGTDPILFIHTVANLSQSKMSAESRTHDPNLRKMLGCALTLDRATQWLMGDEEAITDEPEPELENDTPEEQLTEDQSDEADAEASRIVTTVASEIKHEIVSPPEDIDVQTGTVENINFDLRAKERLETLIRESEIYPGEDDDFDDSDSDYDDDEKRPVVSFVEDVDAQEPPTCTPRKRGTFERTRSVYGGFGGHAGFLWHLMGYRSSSAVQG